MNNFVILILSVVIKILDSFEYREPEPVGIPALVEQEKTKRLHAWRGGA